MTAIHRIQTWVRAAGAAALILASAAATPSNAKNPLPAPPAEMPEGVSDLPEGFDAYRPPVNDAAAGRGAPGVSQWTRSAGADETVVLAGYAFSGARPRFELYAQGADGEPIRRTVEAVAGDANQALLVLPKDLPQGMVLLWPVNAAGPGRPVAVNKAEAWWAYPRKAEPGGTLSVFGRNLVHRTTGRAWVYVRPENGTGRWLDVSAANPYRVDATLPEDLPDGKYQVWVHNGHGGKYGFSALHQGHGGAVANKHITVQAGRWTWDGPVVNVVALGARGDGKTDCSPAIARALAQARGKKRPTVYFPAGRYLISKTIRELNSAETSGLRLLGAGKKLTRIIAAEGFGPKNMIALDGPHIEVRGMTFDLNSLPTPKDKRRRRAVLGKIAMVSPGHQNELRLIDVAVDAQRSLSANFGGRTDALIRGCDFIGRECQTATMKNVMIDDCHFLGRADAPVMMYWYGGWNISVTRCTGADFNREDPNSWDTAMGRFFTVTRYGQRHDNVYIAENRTTDLTVRPQHYNQNSGEQIMWESINAHGQAEVVSATSDTVTLASKVGGRKWYSDVIVIAGKGLGQTRMLSDRSGQTLTVARPWDVQPDETSTVLVADAINRVVVYKNHLDAKPRAHLSEKHIASAGVEPFGGSHTLIVAGNTFHELRTGIATFGLGAKNGSAAPTFCLHVVDNVFEKLRWGLHHRSGGGEKAPAPGLSTFGAVIRRNVIRGIIETGCRIGASGAGGRTTMDTNVIEHNRFEDVGAGIVVNVNRGRPRNPTGVRRLLVRDNRIDLAEGAEAGEAIEAADPEMLIEENNKVK